MSVFAVHTIVHRDGRAVAFVPGDELPEWAEGKVGAHCLESEEVTYADAEDEGSGADGDLNLEPDAEGEEDQESADDAEDEDLTPEPADVPDFTAPKQTRSRRR